LVSKRFVPEAFFFFVYARTAFALLLTPYPLLDISGFKKAASGSRAHSNEVHAACVVVLCVVTRARQMAAELVECCCARYRRP
jgi:hypothetical protein